MEIPNFLEGGAYGLLNDVLSMFQGNDGYAQPNRYEVIILPPSGGKLNIGGGNNQNIFASLMQTQSSPNNLRQLSLRAGNVTLPGRNLATSEEGNIYGPNREIVEGVTYADDISISFQASNDLRERVFFENWQKLAFNETSWNMGYYWDYVGTIEIYMLDKQDQKRYGIKLWEAFPKTVEANQLAYDTNDTLMLTPVSFTFRYWTSLDQNQNPGGNIFDKMTETVVNVAERNITRNIPRVLNRL
jgi:hypothetical protein